jgi:hypothetical protein
MWTPRFRVPAFRVIKRTCHTIILSMHLQFFHINSFSGLSPPPCPSSIEGEGIINSPPPVPLHTPMLKSLDRRPARLYPFGAEELKEFCKF